MNHFFNKVSVITGASRGIGRAIALRLAKEGSQVVLSARSQADLDSAAAEIEQAGGQAAALAQDLREPHAGAQLAEFALNRFGRIDIVVNNAGATKRGEFTDLTQADFADGFALKYFGAVNLTRAAWPHLKSSGGSVVFISGAGGRTPGAQFAIGGSVNAALLSLTKALAEAGIRDGIQVNCINPGNVRTDRYTLRVEALAKQRGISTAEAEKELAKESRAVRVGEPSEIAALVAFITGPEGRYLQGSLIDMDGGSTKTI